MVAGTLKHHAGSKTFARPRRPAPPAPSDALRRFWSLEPEQVLAELSTTERGLSADEAARRLRSYGPNVLKAGRRLSRASVLWNQVKSPLLLLLVAAAAVAAASGDFIDAGVVWVILVVSVGLGYSREYRASLAAARLSARVRTRARVVRGGEGVDVDVAEVVPGDVVLVSAGSLVPADGVLLSSSDFFVNQAVLTGESFPVEKRPGASGADAGLAARAGCVYLGTHVRTGAARFVAVATGAATEYGKVAGRLRLRPPETEFDRGLRHFGYLLTTAMFVMVLAVFTGNVILGRDPLETVLFAIALAVGLSPELLPAILNVNLARGAQSMARHGVLVRRLQAIENLGSMDVLCTDKTGTLTEGDIRLDGALDPDGRESADVLELASLNAALQASLTNPLDAGILARHRPALGAVEKLGEVPYDFVRKRMSVAVRRGGERVLVTKGAVTHVLEVCGATPSGALDDARRRALKQRFDAWSADGVRVLAVATRRLGEGEPVDRAVERDLVLEGFLTFRDEPKEGVEQALRDLAGLGVAVKLITGDTKLVAVHVARQVGLRVRRVVTGQDLDELKDEALWRCATETDLFVEVDPNQKERIILSLKKMGHVVGFLGDGINDAPAMHAADTSLSVEAAADVAREAADFVLLERDLDVIRRGIEEGRTTFANTLKYVLTTSSANLGNMISMAVASLFLPFLPLLASQILLNNFLSDVPALGLAGDSVDRELVERPRRWDMGFIGRFMIEFGLLSSAFDLLTFGVLLWMLHAGPAEFRTAWFAESLLTELLVAFVVRTRRPFWKSRPGRLLLYSSVALVALTFAVPYLPYASLLGFVPLPAGVVAAVVLVTLAYVSAAELAKTAFFRKAA